MTHMFMVVWPPRQVSPGKWRQINWAWILMRKFLVANHFRHMIHMAISPRLNLIHLLILRGAEEEGCACVAEAVDGSEAAAMAMTTMTTRHCVFSRKMRARCAVSGNSKSGRCH